MSQQISGKMSHVIPSRHFPAFSSLSSGGLGDPSTPRSASYSRLSLALHRFLPNFSSPNGRRYRRSKSAGNLGPGVGSNGPFGPISIIGQQLSPRDGWHDDIDFTDYSPAFLTESSDEGEGDGSGDEADAAAAGRMEKGSSRKKSKKSSLKERKSKARHRRPPRTTKEVSLTLSEDSKGETGLEIGIVKDVIVGGSGLDEDMSSAAVVAAVAVSSASAAGAGEEVDSGNNHVGERKLIRMVSLSDNGCDGDVSSSGHSPIPPSMAKTIPSPEHNNNSIKRTRAEERVKSPSDSRASISQRRKSKRKSKRKEKTLLVCSRCGRYSTTSKRKLARHEAEEHAEVGEEDEGDAARKVVLIKVDPPPPVPTTPSTESIRELVAAKVKLAPPLYPCRHCDFSTSKERRLGRHLRKVHGSVEVAAH